MVVFCLLNVEVCVCDSSMVNFKILSQIKRDYINPIKQESTVDRPDKVLRMTPSRGGYVALHQ